MKNYQKAFAGFSLITALLVILKLQDIIDWSWWFVFAPLWVGPILLSIVLVTIFWMANLILAFRIWRAYRLLNRTPLFRN